MNPFEYVLIVHIQMDFFLTGGRMRKGFFFYYQTHFFENVAYYLPDFFLSLHRQKPEDVVAALAHGNIGSKVIYELFSNERTNGFSPNPFPY